MRYMRYMLLDDYMPSKHMPLDRLASLLRNATIPYVPLEHMLLAWLLVFDYLFPFFLFPFFFSLF
ncbi:MAG: hypothetical protein AYK19_03795 [Theionarchaea archaeon DG-70-1]|nr:MAG: hypothetical protein AYK19_03795 [Theionarchaea archaeon DG-70-1]